jgi:GDP-mannose 6-dehydrogenase
MNVSVFGMGYVGTVTAACLAETGHRVWGVDVNPDKLALLNEGRSPIVERRVDEMVARAWRDRTLTATSDPVSAVRATEVSIVCVGTPSAGNGSLDLRALRAVTEQVGGALRLARPGHTVVFRSTMVPGTARRLLIPILEAASGLRAHRDFHVCVNPEFLREGSAVADFYDPPFVVLGEETPAAGDAVAPLYAGLRAPLERTTLEIAEMLKYACNAFHALKVAFANEIGTFCKDLGIDSHRLMTLFALDRKLNISPAYLRPGFAFGGSCLPKDLRALLHLARQRDLDLPLLGAVLESNRRHLERALQWIVATGLKRVGVLGLSFKPGTDDLRESPSVALVETLIGKGYQVRIYDPDVSLARIVGANKRYIEREIPHISCLLCDDPAQVTADADIVVIAKALPGLDTILAACREKLVYDLVRAPLDGAARPTHYQGICW